MRQAENVCFPSLTVNSAEARADKLPSTGLVLTALAESKLTVLGPPPQGPSYSAWTDQLTALQDSLQAEIDTYTLPLPQLPAPAGGAEHFTVTEPDILQARILIAWILSLKREWGEVLNVVPEIGRAHV